jgi:hypothetical protein
MLRVLSFPKRLTDCFMIIHLQSRNDVFPTALSPRRTTLNLKW